MSLDTQQAERGGGNDSVSTRPSSGQSRAEPGREPDRPGTGGIRARAIRYLRNDLKVGHIDPKATPKAVAVGEKIGRYSIRITTPGPSQPRLTAASVTDHLDQWLAGSPGL
ncbi:hypothetical protein ElyMa_000757200 [Elysia marginata]|uniref:Uncharacterized protein n=1 Tax=Elysia marginata TaxID=1093978 RepID=A0AAV4GRA9_9GAST|nr:hypothetical protein ElyMa_000757200 [Elysia marginata]